MKTMNLSVTSFWEQLDLAKLATQQVMDKYTHQIKTASLDTLKEILKGYRFFTIYYIADLALLISKMPFNAMRSVLAEILYEELGNGNNKETHPQLYDNFLTSLGIHDTDYSTPHPHISQILTKISDEVVTQSWHYGLGLRGMGGECLCQIYLESLYDAFIRNNAIQQIKAQIDWQFWDIHMGEVDLHHQELMKSTTTNLIHADPSMVPALLAGYERSQSAWQRFWDHIFTTAGVSV
jgi:hypothetical protein